MNNIKKKQICENHSAKGTDTMAVTVQEKERLFTIHTQNTTYQMKADKYGVLLHLYYGRRTEGCMDYLLTYADRGYAANIYDAGKDRTYSLDVLPQEYPVSGTGDMRSPALILEYGNGIDCCDLRFDRYKQGWRKLRCYTECSRNWISSQEVFWYEIPLIRKSALKRS